MPKLTDSQLVILSAAAKRADGVVLPLPKSLKLKGGAATSVLKSLIKKGLVAEQPATVDAAAWRKNEDGRRAMLVITDAGLQVIGVATGRGTKKRATASEARPKKRRQRTARKAADPKPKARTAAAVRPGTKQAMLIDLLRRPKGATIAELVAVTSWQPHSVRGAISGALKKKLGLTVTSENVGKRGRVYHIVERS